MRILILNWRDPLNPNAGGAELLTQEIARRLVKKGHKILQISSNFDAAKKREILDGVEFIRLGKWYSVHIFAFFYYQIFLRNKIDYILDEVHWFPFFSYLYAPNKTIALTCELASNLFIDIFPKPLAFIFRQIEKIYINLYRNVPTLTISKSTFDDLIKAGFVEKNIRILTMGITLPKKMKTEKKEKNPTLVSVGRLNNLKGTRDLITMLSYVHKKIPNTKLWLVGSGEKKFIADLKKQIKKNNLGKSIVFFGFVSQEKKFELISRAHILVSASKQEGWGLTVPEAGIVKTPSVVYNIKGFRDTIIKGKSGELVDNNPKAMSDAVIKILNNKEKYKEMVINSQILSKNYSWDKAAQEVEDFIKKI